MTSLSFEIGAEQKSSPSYVKQKQNAFSIKCNPGCHGPQSPVVGSRAEDLKRISERIEKEPLLGQFESALYYQENSISFNFLIPVDKKKKADEISKGIFLNYIENYTAQNKEIDENSIVDWCLFTQSPGECRIVQENGRNWLGWHVHAKVRQKENPAFENNGNYLPPYLCAYHEVQHIEDVPPLSPTSIWVDTQKKGSELKQTLKTLILCDSVYKEVNELEIYSLVDHGKSLLLNGKKVSIGVIANFYRKLEERHLSLCEALLSPQSIEFLESGGI